GVALLLDPDPHVRESELQMLPEAIRPRTEAPSAPVVDRRNGYAQIGGELADVEQRLQAPGVAGRAVFGVHTEQVRPAPTHGSGATSTVAPLPERDGPRGPRGSQSDGFSMTGSHPPTEKVPETLEFPGPLGRADRI